MREQVIIVIFVHSLTAFRLRISSSIGLLSTVQILALPEQL
jgi:hypothetical protein